MESVVPELKSATQIAAELDGGADTPDPTEDPRDSKEYTFEFSHTDVRGKRWFGKFTNRILTIKKRRQVKVLKAQMAGGVSVAALDVEAWEINEMIAHLSVSLDRRSGNIPKWALDLEDLEDSQIVEKLYVEVASHEARFHRRDTIVSASEESD